MSNSSELSRYFFFCAKPCCAGNPGNLFPLVEDPHKMGLCVGDLLKEQVPIAHRAICCLFLLDFSPCDRTPVTKTATLIPPKVELYTFSISQGVHGTAEVVLGAWVTQFLEIRHSLRPMVLPHIKSPVPLHRVYRDAHPPSKDQGSLKPAIMVPTKGVINFNSHHKNKGATTSNDHKGS